MELLKVSEKIESGNISRKPGLLSRNFGLPSAKILQFGSKGAAPMKALESPRYLSGTIFRYVLNEALLSFFIAFLFFFFIFFVNQILLMVREILERRVPFFEVMLLMIFALPSIVAISTPFASLVGLLMTVGRLTSDNEILVMLSSGLSYRNIFLPAIVVGALISLFSFFVNDVLLPAGHIEFTRLWRRILVSTPALELQANSVTRYRDTFIVTGNIRGSLIENVLIMDRTGDGERRIIMANRAELRDGGDYGLSLELEGAFILSAGEIARDDFDYAYADFMQYWISTADLIPSFTGVSPREMSSLDVYREIARRTQALEWQLNDRRGFTAFSAQTLEEILRAGPAGDAWNRRAAQFASLHREVFVLDEMARDRGIFIHRLEFYSKFALPFGAFSFVFLAVSLGLMAKKSGQTVGFGFGLFISVIYWALMIGGRTMSLRVGTPPFWSIWLPNILALTIGVILAVIRIRK